MRGYAWCVAMQAHVMGVLISLMCGCKHLYSRLDDCGITLHIASGVYAHTTAVCVLQSVPPGAILFHL